MKDRARADSRLVVGYARVSSTGDDVAPQILMLERAGCTRVFVDVASGALTPRPQLDAAIDYVRAGDRLVVCRLDRLGRSLRHLVAVVDTLRSRGVHLQSIDEGLDTSAADGAAISKVFFALADFKRDLLHDRTSTGLSAARARGRIGGRKPALSPESAAVARDMFESGDHTVAEIAVMFDVSRATIYRAIKPSVAAAQHGTQDDVQDGVRDRSSGPASRSAVSRGTS